MERRKQTTMIDRFDHLINSGNIIRGIRAKTRDPSREINREPRVNWNEPSGEEGQVALRQAGVAQLSRPVDLMDQQILRISTGEVHLAMYLAWPLAQPRAPNEEEELFSWSDSSVRGAHSGNSSSRGALGPQMTDLPEARNCAGFTQETATRATSFEPLKLSL